MTKTSLFGAVLAVFGMGVTGALVYKGVPFTITVAVVALGPIGLGALLFDYTELGPLVEKVLGRWRNGG